MASLFPPIEPYVRHSVPVDARHTLYVEECGVRHGIPALFLHGGPGSGCEPYHRRFFDPDRYRVILLDQRGAGRSSPHAELVDNTTAHLIDDLERIRAHLGIERWVVFGGSWGSTLALAYGETWPNRVLGLVLRGIFLCRPRDIRWFYQYGASEVYPEFWEEFVQLIPPREREDLVGAYYRRLRSGDEIARMAAAKAWSLWEGRCSTLRPNPAVLHHFSDPHTALGLARIEAHYFVNEAFLGPNQLLRGVAALRGIPGTIVHGRYDVVCPLENAWSLAQAWPEAQLHVVADAGHSATEPGILATLVDAMNDLADRLAAPDDA